MYNLQRIHLEEWPHRANVVTLFWWILWMTYPQWIRQMAWNKILTKILAPMQSFDFPNGLPYNRLDKPFESFPKSWCCLYTDVYSKWNIMQTRHLSSPQKDKIFTKENMDTCKLLCWNQFDSNIIRLNSVKFIVG